MRRLIPALLLCASALPAQHRVASGVARLPMDTTWNASPQLTVAPRRIPDPAGLALEMGGSWLGLAVGAGAAVLAADICLRTPRVDEDDEIYDCLGPAFLVGSGVGLVGTAVGVTMAARLTGAPRSAGGAVIGTLVGALAGGILAAGITSIEGTGDVFPTAAFLITQGLGSALGSRLAGR
jgi:hypothetical protein